MGNINDEIDSVLPPKKKMKLSNPPIVKEDTSGDDIINDDAFKLNIACDTESDSDSDDDISDSIHSIKSMQNSISPTKSEINSYRPPSPPLIIKQMMKDAERKKHK